VYELPEDGTGVSKHVGVLKDHTFRCVCNLCADFIVQITFFRFKMAVNVLIRPHQ